MVETGAWVFTGSLLLAIIFGFLNKTVSPTILLILVILGLIIGFLNITEKEVHGFLLASIVFLLIGSAVNFSLIPFIGVQVQNSLNNFMLIVAPAAFVVAIKQIFLLASKR